mgnify:CR=1 FL=1
MLIYIIDKILEQIETFIIPRGDVTVNPAVYSSEDSGKGDEMTTYYLPTSTPSAGELSQRPYKALLPVQNHLNLYRRNFLSSPHCI